MRFGTLPRSIIESGLSAYSSCITRYGIVYAGACDRDLDDSRPWIEYKSEQTLASSHSQQPDHT